MPLPGAMFGDPADKAFRPAPRWASVAPEQVCAFLCPHSCLKPLALSHSTGQWTCLCVGGHVHRVISHGGPLQGVLEPGAATDLRLTARVTGGPGSAADVLASGGLRAAARVALEAVAAAHSTACGLG